MEKELSPTEQNLLARLFSHERDARRVLRKAGLSPGDIPSFSSARSFWFEVNVEIRNGILDDGRRRVLKVAQAEYPGNHELRSFLGPPNRTRTKPPSTRNADGGTHSDGTQNLVSVAEDRLIFGDAVARVAKSLSPLGGAARIVAESCACLVTMRELELEEHKVQGGTKIQLAKLANRRAEASAALRNMRDRVGQAELSAQDLRRCIVDMQRELVKPRVPLTEKKLYNESIRIFTTALLNQHSQQGNELVCIIDSVLNGAGAGASAPAAVGGTQPCQAAPTSARKTQPANITSASRERRRKG